MHVEVLEQPVGWGYYFQDKRQPRVWIWGDSSSVANKTYPSIKICGYTGEAVVHVSCVTKSVSYRPHPCMLLGPDCTNGVYICKVRCNSNVTTVLFPKIAIMIMEHSEKSCSIENALNKRKQINVDPFKTGFDHINYAKYFIDLNALRLCFEVYVEDEYGLCRMPLQPVVSNIINNSRVVWSNYSFNIVKLSDRKCPADGGSKDIIAYCDKGMFFELSETGRTIWESYSKPEECKASTIWFKPPKYRALVITEPVRVLMQLLSEDDTYGSYSEAIPFHYLPMEWFSGRINSNSASSPSPLILKTQWSDTEETKVSSAPPCIIL